MTVEEAVRKRYSCRSFLPKEPPQDEIKEILKTAFQSPSCENSQPWHVYVAGKRAMERIREKYEQNRKAKIPQDLDRRFDGRWTEEMGPRIDAYFDGICAHEPHKNFDYTMQKRNLFYAPVMIYLCMDQELPAWSLFDTGMFAQTLMLSATERGLATMASAVSVSYPDTIREILGIPQTEQVVIGIGIGYPDLEQPINSFRTTRKSVEEVRFVP